MLTVCSPRPLGSAAAKVGGSCAYGFGSVRGHSVDILTLSCVPVNRGASHRLVSNSAPHGCRRQIRATGGGERAPSGQASFRSPLASPSHRVRPSFRSPRPRAGATERTATACGRPFGRPASCIFPGIYGTGRHFPGDLRDGQASDFPGDLREGQATACGHPFGRPVLG